MKKVFLMGVCLTVLGGMVGCSKRGGMLMIGLDDEGKEVKRYLPSSKAADMGTAIDSIGSQTLVMLDKYREKSSWELKKVRVGLGLNGQFGLGVVSLEVEPTIEVAFAKQ